MSATNLLAPDAAEEVENDLALDDIGGDDIGWRGLRLLRVRLHTTDHDYTATTQDTTQRATQRGNSSDENPDETEDNEVAVVAEENENESENVAERRNNQSVVIVDVHAEPTAEQIRVINNEEPTNQAVDNVVAVDDVIDVDEAAASSSSSSNSNSNNTVDVNVANLTESPQSTAVASSSAVSIVNLTTPPSPVKKRRRKSDEKPKSCGTPRLNATSDNIDSDEDDGCTCPICLDKWEMVGAHRLISLRCGHLFGESCIKRWLTESNRQSGQKVCPQCKSKTSARDFRHLYAKRVRVVDRSEEHELRKDLEKRTQQVQSLQMEIGVIKMREATMERRLQSLESENAHLRLTLCNRPATVGGLSTATSTSIGMSGGVGIEAVGGAGAVESYQPFKNYKLFMEHNIQLSREQGCRVMTYSRQQCELYVSQKSANVLFPGYGVRVIDATSFRALQFIHLTTKEMRDIVLSFDEQMLVCTSQEITAKLYDFRMRETSTIGPFSDNQNLWACALGGHRNEHTLYLGTQQGSTTVVDIRFPNVSKFDIGCARDLSPVFSVAVIPHSEEFPLGGFVVGKLQSIWFYENCIDDNTAKPFRLDIEGPFLAMCFEPTQQLLILTTRKSMRFSESRFIVGKIKKVGSHATFEPRSTFIGAKNTPIMTRACQITVPPNSLFAAYIQDSKQLALYDVRRQTRLQSLPVTETIYDTCAIYTASDIYLAALTAQKCRIYKLNEI